MAVPPDHERQRGFNWLRWTAIGCTAWLVIMIATGAPFAAIFLIPVIGPLGGWLVGGAFYLLAGAMGRR